MSLPLPPAPRRARRAPLVAAVAVALAAAFTLVIFTHRPPPGQAPGTTTPPPTGRVPARAAGHDARIAVSVAGWRVAGLDGTLVPLSPTGGPRISGRLASGFADSPEGAVLAAVNIAIRTSGQLGPEIFGPTISRQVTGPGSGALLTAAWRDYAQAQQMPNRPGGPAGVATAAARAFRLTAWTLVSATVEVASYDASGQAAVTRLRVVWRRGDWRLIAPPGGNFAAGAVPAGSSLAGFTFLPWR